MKKIYYYLKRTMISFKEELSNNLSNKKQDKLLAEYNLKEDMELFPEKYIKNKYELDPNVRGEGYYNYDTNKLSPIINMHNIPLDEQPEFIKDILTSHNLSKKARDDFMLKYGLTLAAL